MQENETANNIPEIHVNVSVHILNINRKEMIDAIVAETKLTKTDAAKALETAIASRISLKNFKAMEPEL